MSIMATGFNGSEADHEGVCVEEVPFRERSSANGRRRGLPETSYAEYNLLQCDHQFMVKCFSRTNDSMYGTLSHSHLLLVLLAWLMGADWKVEDEPNMCNLLNPDGSFSSAAVAACDADLERVVRDGLVMEVVSWTRLVEEPTAASLISQALNKAHSMAPALPNSRH